jgi:hypothetical protein
MKQCAIEGLMISLGKFYEGRLHGESDGIDMFVMAHGFKEMRFSLIGNGCVSLISKYGW